MPPMQPVLGTREVAPHPAAVEPPVDRTGELLTRIAELLKTIDELKAEKEKSNLEKEDLLRKYAESETSLLLRMKETDELSSVIGNLKKDVHYSREELDEARKHLGQAKEMWMKESSRATKLRENLDKAELDIADKDKAYAKLTETFKKTETENTNLKHLLNKSNEIVSTKVITQQTVDNAFAASDSYFVRGGTVASLSAPQKQPNSLFTNPNIMSSSPVGAAPTERTMMFGAAPVTPKTGRLGSGGPATVPTSSKYLQLCVTNDGVLYEDEIIQVGIKAKFTGLGEGVLGVYYGNKTSGTIQNFQTKYSLDASGETLHLTTSPIPTQLGPKHQLCQRVSAQISGAFIESPKLTVSFLLPDNTPRTVPLRLPVAVNKFMQGRELRVEEFFSNWRQQLFLLNESSGVVNVAMNLAQIARTCQLGGALHLHHQVDEVPDNLVLVGQFPSDSPDGIRCATIPEALVLVRVEVGTGVNGGKTRIAVRSNDGLVAEAVKVCLANQLSAAGA